MRATSRSVVFVFVFALALFAPSTMIGAAPEAVLAKNEVPVIGLGFVHDRMSADIRPAGWASERADEAALAQNVSALVSDARVHFVRAMLMETEIVAVSREQFTVAAKKNKKILNMVSSSGADLVQLWPQLVGVASSAATPFHPAHFVPESGWSLVPAGAWVSSVTHEFFHNLGLRHNPEVAPGSGAWPWAVGQLYADGTCDPVSYCGGNSVPLLSAGNAKMARLSGVWVSGYNPNPPSSQVVCEDTADQACLANDRVVVQVFWVTPGTYDHGFATMISSNGTMGTFEIGSARIRVRGVAAQVKKGGKSLPVVNIRFATLTPTAPSVPYRVLITDVASGHVRAWDFLGGERATLQVPRAAF